MIKIAARGIGALIAGLTLLGPGMPRASSAELTTVTLGYPARVSLTIAPIFAAMKLGYFADEGIQVKIIEFKGSSVVLPQIANKSIMIGFPNPDPLILARQPGRDPFPIKFFYNVARGSIWEYAVPADSQIKSLDDLRGKKIGVGAISNGNVPIIKATLKERGLVAGKDYTLISTGDGPPAFHATLKGEVDAYNANDVFIARFAQVAKIRKLDVPEKFRNLFSNGFAAHVDTIRDNATVLAGFGRAITKAMHVCTVNVDFCVLNFWELNPALKPGAGPVAAMLGEGRQMLQTRMAKYTQFSPGQPHRFGEYSATAWRDFVEVLHGGGQLSTQDIDTSQLYTNELVDRFNDFDAAAIERQAERLK